MCSKYAKLYRRSTLRSEVFQRAVRVHMPHLIRSEGQRVECFDGFLAGGHRAAIDATNVRIAYD